MSEPREPTSFFAPPAEEPPPRAQDEQPPAQPAESHPFDAPLAVEPVTVEPPPIELAAVEPPPVELAAVEPPPVELAAVEPPPVELAAVEPPPIELAAVEPPPIELPRVDLEPAPLSFEPAPLDPLTAPRGTFEDTVESYIRYDPTTPFAPAPTPSYDEPLPDGGARDRQAVEQLLSEVRGALAVLPAGPDTGPLAAAVDALRRELAELRGAQASGQEALLARLDELAAAGSSPVAEPQRELLADLHDGLVGVRTDLTALPEQLGPAVTSAVAHGLAATGQQLAAAGEALVAATGETTALRTALGDPGGALAQLPALVDRLRELADRLDAAATVPPPSPAPAVSSLTAEDLAAVLGGLETRLTRHTDEAVLALAQAVLRRPAPPAGPGEEPSGDSAEDDAALADRLEWDEAAPAGDPAPDDAALAEEPVAAGERRVEAAADVLPEPEAGIRRGLFHRRS